MFISELRLILTVLHQINQNINNKTLFTNKYIDFLNHFAHTLHKLPQLHVFQFKYQIIMSVIVVMS